MRIFSTIFTLLVVLGTSVVADGKKPEGPVLRLIIRLKDGSRIKGTPLRQNFPFASSLTSLDLPLVKLRKIECQADSKESVCSFVNGDRLQGSLGLEVLEVESIFGKAKIDIRHVQAIEVCQIGAEYWPRDGLWGYWPLDGNAEDASGNEHHGQIQGAKPTAGIIGEAYSFDGSAGIDVGNPDFSSEQYTVSGWLRTDCPAKVDDWKTWIDKLDDSGGPFELGLCDGRGEVGMHGPQFLVWDGGQGVVNFSDSTNQSNLRDGKWRMFTVTYEKGSQKVYVDGALVGSLNYAGHLPANKTPVRIGGHHFGPYHHPWIGDVDEVFIYQRVLSASEVEALFSRGQVINSSETDGRPAR